ncbi:MAG: ribosome assembly RNA-binding protein YhbY [Deltaproteobacteria bacterium]|nr:ribosome assembly RNA-binding protein YhbY [Deltaproteobacteria bacterium]
MKLSSKQKSCLKGLGHHLKPIIQIGKDGLSEKFIANLEDALEHHELLKIRVLDNAPTEKKELAASIEKASRGAVVQIIGHTLLYYRPFAEEPLIMLPKK